jgi:hypothetical protein
MLYESFPSPKTFYMTRSWRLRFLFLFIIISTLLVVVLEMPVPFLWDVGMRKLGILFVFLCISIPLAIILVEGLCMYLLIKPIKHIVTSDGITFCSFGYRIYTPWKNITGIGVRRFGIYSPPVLLFRHRAIKGRIQDGIKQGNAVVESRLELGKNDVLDALPLLFTVPKNWQESELGAYIKYYASQTFSTQNT